MSLYLPVSEKRHHGNGRQQGNHITEEERRRQRESALYFTLTEQAFRFKEIPQSHKYDITIIAYTIKVRWQSAYAVTMTQM